MNTKRTVLFATMLAAGTAAQAADSISEMFSEGQAHAAFRYRFELVDQDGFDMDAEASTIRTRLNFKTDDFKGWSAFIELDDLHELGFGDFNAGGSTTPDRTAFPVVADPEYTELNQLFVQYKTENNQFRGGRQRINLDNQRFIGGVGWRQNEQTYDAFSWVNRSFKNTEFFYAYVDQVNRIFGEDSPVGKHDNETHLLNVSHTFEGVGKLSGYYYGIDNNNAAAFNTDTFGVRFTGQAKPGDWTLKYTAEAAFQSDAGNNPVDFDENYLRLDGTLVFEPVQLTLGYEVLGGDTNNPGGAFRTPLATLHAFNGWADKFLGTPSAGLEDVFLGAAGNLGTWKWKAVYHDFQPDSSGPDYGSEIDVSLARKFGKSYGLLLKAADFDGESGIADTTKVWAMFSANF